MSLATTPLTSIEESSVGLSLAQLLAKHPESARRTILRVMARLIEEGRVEAIGAARARRYRASALIAPTAALLEEFPPGIPLSADSRDIVAYVDQPLETRRPVGYQRDFQQAYEPNRTWYLPESLRRQLHRMGITKPAGAPAGTYSRAPPWQRRCSGKFLLSFHSHRDRAMDTRTPQNFEDLPRNFAELVAPARTALVLWDLQKGLAGKASNLATLKANAAALIAAAEKAGVMVAWSEHTFPPLDQMSGPWLAWMMRRQGVARPQELKPMFQAGSADVAWLEGFQPLPHHLVLKKQQPSLFFNTPFDHHLRIKGIRTIVLVGFATDIGIDFTARHGNALGYHSVIVEDATGAYAQANHERSIAFLSDWANVASTAQVVAQWGG